MIRTTEFNEMCKKVSNVETTINFYKTCLHEIERKIDELGDKEKLSRRRNLEYLSYKYERKELGNKIRNAKEFKKEISRKISEYENEYVEGMGICYKISECRYVKFDGKNIEDVFKFSHSSSYAFENETLTIFGKKNLFINIGEYLVFDGEYHVYDEETFNESFTSNVGNCGCCGCCSDDEEFK